MGELKEVMNVMQVSGERKPSGYYKKTEVDEAIAELKKKCDAEKSIGATFSENGAELARWVEELKTEINRKDGVGKRWFERCMEARTENIKLKRSLWLARAEMARTSAWVFWNRKDDYNYNKWKKVERKCRAKAEEYK
jgi:hypothetical protein